MSGLQSTQRDIHDPDPNKAQNLITEVLTHPADLSVKALSQNDAKGPGTGGGDLTRPGHRAQNGHAGGHSCEKSCGYWTIDRDNVFFFVPVAGSQDFIDDAAVIGEKNQAFGITIESAHRKDALVVSDKINDIVAAFGIGGTGDANGFVESDIDMIFIRKNRFTFDTNNLTGSDTHAERGDLVIHSDQSGLNEAIGLAAAAGSAVGNILIESDGGAVSHGQHTTAGR